MMRNRITRTRLTHAPRSIFHALLCAFALCLVAGAPPALTARQQAPQIRTAPAQATPQPSPAPTQPAQPSPTQPADQGAAQPAAKVGFYVVDAANRSVADVRREDVSLTVDGAPQPVTYFAREESPVGYGLVIDNSGSVRQILDLLARTAGTLVAANRAEDEAFVMRFVDQPRTSILEDFTSDRQALASALSDMYVEGGQTAVIDAIYRAAEHAAEHRGANRRLALVVITDGEDRGSAHTPEELTQLLRREGVRVFVIGLTGLLDKTGGFIHKSSREKASDLLETIAAESGGRAFFPAFGKTVGDELTFAIKEIGDSMRTHGYVVGFTPPGTAAGGKFRKVQVRVNEVGRGKRKVIGVPGYFEAGGSGQTVKE